MTERFWCQADCGRRPPMDERNIVDIKGERKYLCDICYREYTLDQQFKHGEV